MHMSICRDRLRKKRTLKGKEQIVTSIDNVYELLMRKNDKNEQCTYVRYYIYICRYRYDTNVLPFTLCKI